MKPLELEVKEIREDDGGRYVAAYPDEPESELTYRLNGDRMVIERTYTPEELRGQGIARRLVEQAVEDARERGWKIIPVCSYAKIAIERSPDLRDVLDPEAARRME
ncbi:GNAT family N-acetyltransferase [Marinicauda salina]|uniref:GNAT family N-acetyltransferase n=1 Tax=Marinicauda salina TaxID=2135793 RepID=A0A2U2BUJ3_9PROT|nr:GNAT family N-acetyltransferase [Marinicauda salina]PWE17678.1 GNAT family N-acetyltransferase [Marinicauda salina]